MASKRMFDKAIIDTDKFMDLPVSAKAMYFLLGIDADDEGFVSSRKVLRVHGGTIDDVKVLSAKGFVIPFKGGVVVITDWHTNNWLDSRRTKPTQYQKERSLLTLISAKMGNPNDKKYVLSSGLASAEPEENRIEEKSIEQNRRKGTGAASNEDFIEKKSHIGEMPWHGKT